MRIASNVSNSELLEKPTEIRMYGDVEEHKHPSRDYWHPSARIHAKELK